MDPKFTLPDDTVVGNWKIGSELGRGGQGIVWSVRATTTRRAPPRALKACFSDDATDRARFVREIELLRRCTNAPNILQVVDSDSTWSDRVAGVPPFAFYVSERCEGSLEEKKRRLGDAGARLAIFREACEAVRFLHELDEPLIHRDVKPANFLLALEPRRLVLADFGIARVLDTSETLTQIQEVVGTQHFRAPEVTSGRPPSLKSDIYSLGRVLEWLLTGEVSTDLGTRPVPRGDRLSDEACVLLDGVIVKACQPVAGSRYASVQELVASLPALWLSPKPRAEMIAVAVPAALNDKQALAAARALAKADDRGGWREAELNLKRTYVEQIRQWRVAHEPPALAENQDAYIAFSDSLLKAVMPRLAFALGGVDSQNSHFADQRRAMEQLVVIQDWNWGGYDIALSAPLVVGFFFHYLHGALCCELGRFDLALQLAMMALPDKDRDSKSKPLLDMHQLIGWPKTLGGDYKYSAASLQGAFERFEVLRELFADEADFQVGLASYSLLLSVLELAGCASEIAGASKQQLNQTLRLDIPPMFIGMNRDRIGAAARRTVGSPDVVELVAQVSKTSRADLVKAWPNWKSLLLHATGRSYHGDVPLGDIAT